MSSVKGNIDYLIENCRKKDQKAQEKLYKQYYGLMMNLCMRYTNNNEEAMDVLQSGFLKIFININKYKCLGSFEGWMKKIFINTALDKIKSKKIHDTIVEKMESRETHLIENKAVEALEEEDIIKIIQELPPASKTVCCSGCLNKCNTKRNAVRLPTPGNWDISFTAFSKSLEENSIGAKVQILELKKAQLLGITIGLL